LERPGGAALASASSRRRRAELQAVARPPGHARGLVVRRLVARRAPHVELALERGDARRELGLGRLRLAPPPRASAASRRSLSRSSASRSHRAVPTSTSPPAV
jgi:hypothetical protein